MILFEFKSCNLTLVYAQHILRFFESLSFPEILPPGIEVMNPYTSQEAFDACKKFYDKYYNDNHKRHLLIGINPGRFGAGVTGIPFTDPIRLESECGIENNWAKKQELSSVYMYEMIKAFGGAEAFFQKIYITAVSPLGFTRDGKNLNYYDDRQLEKDIQPYVIDCFEKQLKFGVHRDVAFCLGEGKNFAFLKKLNEQQRFFEKIIPLAHPRFIMQYKLKKKQEYIDHYLEQFNMMRN